MIVLTSLSPIISSIYYKLSVIQVIKLDIYRLIQSVSTKATIMKRAIKCDIYLLFIKKPIKLLPSWVFCY
ncbi:hypothetical protein CJF31_00004492 [Rutstroemia sp. NJR-2017a BVV2]|nr:hypothetical protein CJF31_00004492 [Rutstroemia sp. NJR-2017a BVV2]